MVKLEQDIVDLNFLFEEFAEQVEDQVFSLSLSLSFSLILSL